MAARSYRVSGMSCEHCKAAVADEVGAVEGVESVRVDLAEGLLEVEGPSISDEAIAAAVEEAGYALTTSDR